MLTSLLDKPSLGSEWQVPKAHTSREVNLLRGLHTPNQHNQIDHASLCILKACLGGKANSIKLLSREVRRWSIGPPKIEKNNN